MSTLPFSTFCICHSTILIILLYVLAMKKILWSFYEEDDSDKSIITIYGYNSRQRGKGMRLLSIKLTWLFIFFVNITYALKIDRVILSTDNNPMYIQFWPIVAKAWKEIVGIKPTLALIADESVMVDESLGDVIRFKPIEGVPTSLHAQVVRLLLPIYFEDEACLISDIDMIPLQKEYFIDSVAHIPEDHFVVYRNDWYGDNVKQFPMCYNLALGKTFKEVLGIESVSDIPGIIKKWHDLCFGWSTDEMMLYQYLTNWSHFNDRCTRLCHGAIKDIRNNGKRIDRADWLYDEVLLKNGYYIDAHCLRPYETYKEEIDKVLQCLGL